MSTQAHNVVLVHGGFVDGSGWQLFPKLGTASRASLWDASAEGDGA
ncbi:hypothetical protein [Streptomyces humi]